MFGTTEGAPLASVLIGRGRLGPPSGPVVWAAELDGVHRHEMSRDAGGGLVLAIGGVAVLQIAADRASATIGEVRDAIGWQLATTFAVPLAAQAAGAFVLHAAVAARADGAIAVCAESGTGKSTLLTALIDAGWAAVTEDLVAVEGGRAWPGPPWVRLAPGQQGPRGSAEMFRTADKIGWNLDGGRCVRPTPLRHIVLLDPAAPQPTTHRPATPEEVIGALAHHTPWFEEPARRGEALFGGAVQLARSVPATRLRLRRSDGWTDEAVGIIADL